MADGIRDWLEGIGLAEYYDAFVENAVDQALLPHLTNEDLKDLGIAKLGDRKKLLLAIGRLETRIDTEPAEAADLENASAGPVEADRRQLTVMFVDLVDSTALSTELDPEDLREVMRRYQDAVAGAVTRYAGHIAKYLGDGVLAYFGWPQAHEDQAERAVRAGLDAVAAVRNLSFDDGVSLQSRVGIATGQVVIGDLVGEAGRDTEAVTGETPILAARLQDEAEANHVVIGAATRHLLGQTFALEDLNLRSLKGFAEPKPVWRVVGERVVVGRFEAVHVGRLTTFIGREEEVSLLQRRWEQAKQGEGQVVLLSGDAGIGKSRLTRTVMENIAREPHTRLRFQCSPHHVNSALHPFIDQLERAAVFEGGDDAAVKLSKLETLLRQASDDIAEVIPLFTALLSLPASDEASTRELDPQRQRQLIFEALLAQLAGLAAREPVLLLFEDAHWADPTTLELLQQMVDRVQEAPILALITGRPEFQPTWPGHAHITRLTLNRLDRRQGAAIVADLAGDKSLPDEVLDEIVAKSDGVPLFVEELTKTVLESDLLTDTGERYMLTGQLPPLAIPSTLQDSLMARLDRLAPVKEVAQIGAAIGREFGHQLLAAISPQDENQLEEALARLVESELIFRRGTGLETRYIFKHALIQDTAYASLLKSRRQELHRRIAAAIEKLTPESMESKPEILAHHYTEAGVTEQAIAYWSQAGRRAVDRTASAEAIAHVEKGLVLLEALPVSDSRVRMEIELRTVMGIALVHTMGGTTDEYERNYFQMRALCERVGDTKGLGESIWGLWYNRNHTVQFAAAEALSAELLALARAQGDTDMLLQAHHSGWTTALAQGNLTGALHHTQQGCQIYDMGRHGWHAIRFGGHDPGVCARNSQARVQWLLGYPDQAAAAADDARRLGAAVSHPYSQGNAHGFAVLVYVFCGRIDLAVEAAAAARSVAEKFGYIQSPWYYFALLAEAWVATQQGAWQQAMDITRSVLQRRTRSTFRPYLRAFAAEICLRTDRLAEGRELIDEALASVASDGENWWTADLHRLNGELLRQEGADYRAMEAAFHEALDTARGRDAKSLELRAATSLARLWRDQDKIDQARDVLAPVYGWFTEGFDTPDLKDAKGLLDELN